MNQLLATQSSPRVEITAPDIPPPIQEPSSVLAGTNVLIEGPTGVGKTYSIGTLVDASPKLEVFFLALESGIESLLGYWTDRKLAIPPNLHWNVLDMSGGDWLGNLATKAKQIGDMTQESLYKLQDMTRGQRNHLHTMLKLLADFEDQRTGQKYGSVGKWGPNRALVIDGLTGLGYCAMSLVIGNKPVRSQTDWGIAQDQIEGLIVNLCDNCKMHFVLLSHIEREVDQITQGTRITVSTLGRALAPKIPNKFSDVILAVRNGTNWSWSTANPTADLKTRNLPVADGLKPDFAQILDKWRSRGGAFSPTVKAGT